MVGEEQIELKTAYRVQSLPKEVFQQLQSSTLTFSQRRQFLSELFEVSCKQKLSGQDITGLADRALQEKQPLAAIRRLRFPTLTAMEKSFTALEEELLRGTGVQLRPPPYFEGDTFIVEFGFNSAKTLSRKLNTLQAIEGRLDAFFELLH